MNLPPSQISCHKSIWQIHVGEVENRRNTTMTKFPIVITITIIAAILSFASSDALAQPLNARIGETIPRDVREMYERGLQYLAQTQSENGDWAALGGHN